MIPSSSVLDQSAITTLLTIDPLVQQYRTFFSLLDWSFVDRWQALRSPRGRPGHPECAYLKAFFIRQHQQFSYTSQLRLLLMPRLLSLLTLPNSSQRKKKSGSFRGMGQALLRLLLLGRGTLYWLNIPNPSMKVMSPIFVPLYQRTVMTLSHHPTYLTADELVAPLR